MSHKTANPVMCRIEAGDLPEVRTVLDGRGMLDAADWPGVTVVPLGGGGATYRS